MSQSFGQRLGQRIETNARFFVIIYLDCDEFRRAALYQFT